MSNEMIEGRTKIFYITNFYICSVHFKETFILLNVSLLQISDIVVGQEPNVTAREALLRWARRSTARYPGVRVTDFTCSWRDGLAFSALLHRNRPDLVDWRTARSSQPRERLDRVFYVAEREYGVTRLLDPEGNDRLSIRSSVPCRNALAVLWDRPDVDWLLTDWRIALYRKFDVREYRVCYNFC